MADAKISDLTALAGSALVSTDLFPVVDVSATTAGSKKMTVDELLTGLLGATSVLGTTYALASAASFGWSTDLKLWRDAAAILSIQNGTNAQNLYIYNTWSSAGANYERGFIAWNKIANQLHIGTEAGGTGTARQLVLNSGGGEVYVRTSGTTRCSFATNDFYTLATMDIGLNGSWRNFFQTGYHQLDEMSAPAAPAANKVRIYAEDNGSGKTRLMAIFPSGAAQQVAIEP